MPSVAVIGCGDVSSVHFDAIADIVGAELVAVCDSDPTRLDAVSQSRGVPGFTTLTELLEVARPDVVHVCTPHQAHAALAVEALRAGVHVLLEKPLASTRAEGHDVMVAAASSSAKFAVCFQNRYNPTSVRLRAELDSGRWGKVLGARAQVMWTRTAAYYQAKPWRGTWEGSGGGLLMNQAIHTLDLVQWLLGDVADVRGSYSTLLFGDSIEVEDTAEAVLPHVSGIRTNFYATLTHFKDAPVLIEITCEQGVLRLEGDLRAIHADGTMELLAQSDVVRTERNYWGASHVRLINDFYAQLSSNEPFWIGADEAYKSLAIAQAVYGR